MDRHASVQECRSVSQQELAEWIGASREAVVKALRLLRDRGVIVTSPAFAHDCARNVWTGATLRVMLTHTTETLARGSHR